MIPALFIAMASFSGCKGDADSVIDPNDTIPIVKVIKELPKMYLNGNLVVGEHAIVRTQAELLAIFPQEEIEQSPDLMEIDFNTQTLLIGRDVYECLAVFNYDFSLTGQNQYTFTVDIFGGWTIYDYGFLYGIVVTKLPVNAEVIFNINKQSHQ